MNPFNETDVAKQYDEFYQSEFGKQIDQLEKAAVEKILSNIPKCTMLELGCGTGHWTAFFAEHGFSIVAIDPAKAMLDIAQSKNIPNTTFIETSAEQIPYCFDSFQLTAAITVLEFTANPEKVLHEIHRVTKNKGHVLVGCLNPNSILFKNKSENSVFKHAKFFTKSEFIQMASFMGNIEISEAVFVDEAFNIHPYSQNHEPAFIIYHITINK